ncbi:DM13 domain-containing protein [Amycolatopsis japonica]|uniref:DM13 domain-containing protein n=1 Tax=Amycolatopsis japonica TaxID=208439 RepID=UPI0037944766
MKRKRVLAVVAAGLVVAVAAGLYWFQPWKLWVNETVQEALPVAAPTSESAAPAPKEPMVVATGALISHEHATTGDVRILRAADGSLVLRLENLDTSNGPDLRVWLTDAPVIPGKDGWFVFDDGAYVSAGKLKGNKGSQNYALPAGTDLARYSSVTIWCDRFNVSFGAAELAKI